ncbi:MAG: DUF6398 domain-containing protein [Prevotellaceae bacterium]|jgi:hypothetical protein|nr:DUF6398 domain-containing protein [Prevotellaceae bacterium]
MDKEKKLEKQQQIINLTNAFCSEVLKDDEYAALAQKMVQKLGRKRNVPFETGKTEIWAAAVIHALGTINFLFDKSLQPYASVAQINEYFGTKQSTVGNKSKEIREMLNLSFWDSEFSTATMEDSNPFAKFTMSPEGLIVFK